MSSQVYIPKASSVAPNDTGLMPIIQLLTWTERLTHMNAACCPTLFFFLVLDEVAVDRGVTCGPVHPLQQQEPVPLDHAGLAGGARRP